MRETVEERLKREKALADAVELADCSRAWKVRGLRDTKKLQGPGPGVYAPPPTPPGQTCVCNKHDWVHVHLGVLHCTLVGSKGHAKR